MPHFKLILLAVCALSSPIDSAPFISEFSAKNDTGITDQDGAHSDWVEIRNPDAVAVNLDGWYLTDTASNRTKWRIPAVTVPANGHLLVFASGKERAVPGSELHTNFSLSDSGEYLGLILPDGATVVSEFTPKFPAQFADVSYGVPSATVASTLVAGDVTAKWVVPQSATNPGASWAQMTFQDSSWHTATMGLGYMTRTNSPDYLAETGAGGNLQTALFGNANTQTVYVRIPFTAPAGGILSLKLRVKYDDGFIGFLNGKPMLSNGTRLARNAPNNPVWSSRAAASNPDFDAIQYAEFDISDSIPDLGQNNLMAFQFLNQGPNNSDALFKVELVASVADNPTTGNAYFAVPTPGKLNGGIDTSAIPRYVTYSQPQGTFPANFQLILAGAGAGEEIRYTTNGTLPTATSTLYTGPISVSNDLLIRARLRNPTLGTVGLVSSAHYSRLAASVVSYRSTGAAFKSALPILVMDNFNGGELANDDTERPVRVHLIDRDATTGYASINAAPAYSGSVDAKLRGSSSAGFLKKPYGIEFVNEGGTDISVNILGMKGEDFALTPCYSFDRTFVRNAWIFDAARQAGLWSPDSRLVEVFFNQNGTNISYPSGTSEDYRGVYLLSEVVRRDDSRVDISKLEAADSVLPAVSGGYIFKIDRADADEFNWRTSRQLPPSDGLILYRPKVQDLGTAQTSYAVDYFQRFEDALYADAAGGFQTRNYRKSIDTAKWIDHNLFAMYAKNVDALRLSAYFVKDRGRRIEGGPLWDFDRSSDNDNIVDNRDADPTQWRGTLDATDYFTYAWWAKLFEDIEFRQAYVDRWLELRRGSLSTTNVHSILDGYSAQFRSGTDSDNPAKRDTDRWYSGNGDFATYSSDLKTWLDQRATWIDSQFALPTTHSLPPGPVVAGTQVGITRPAGTTVYYTLDGSDPRAVGGGVAPGALVASAAQIPITLTTLLTSRAFRSGTFSTPATNWSGMTRTLHTVNEAYASPDNLLVTAIHFSPTAVTAGELADLPEVDASDFSWFEVRNISSGPVNLDGMSLVRERPVSEVTLPPRTLAPGEKALLVKKRDAFTRRYGAGAAGKIAAEWPRDKNLGMFEDDIRLMARDGITRIANFTYKTKWISATATTHRAMEYTGPDSIEDTYETATNWRASAAADGSPGEIAPPGYAEWRSAELAGETENIGPLDDFDQDGMPNLVEYMTGSSPRVFTSSPGTIVLDDTQGLAMDYTRRIDRMDATLSAWQSVGMDIWIEAETDVLISSAGTLEQRRAYFPPGGKGFLRLKAVSN